MALPEQFYFAKERGKNRFDPNSSSKLRPLAFLLSKNGNRQKRLLPRRTLYPARCSSRMLRYGSRL